MKQYNNIAWVTDSTATLSKETLENEHIYVIPLSVIFENTSYLENQDISAEEFYEKLASSTEIPKTSQPAIGEFVKLYETIQSKYDHIIAIHASSALTGTYQGSLTAAEMVNTPVEVINSKVGSFPLGKMLETGIELEKQGLEYIEIVNHLRTLPDKAQLYLSPGSLEQLHKGGRLSTTQAFIGSLIKLNLLLKFDDGKVNLVEKVRTKQRMKNRMFEILGNEVNHIKEVSVIHGDDIDLANSWKEELNVLYPHVKFTTTLLSPVPGTHMGQGTIGLSWIAE